ncbi:MAG: zinc ribbon domain-containing protein [Candidatus Aminicenantes bacterium]|nr:zinc ribbon domain-containing protein [Candidatus Aminicenantes bacterium]
MHCPQCGAEVLENDRFCYSCGADLVRPAVPTPRAPSAASCPQCGQPLRPGDTFCGYCGAEIASPRKAAAVQVSPPKEPSHRFAAFLGYVNTFFCLAVLALNYALWKSAVFEDSLFPFLISRYAVFYLFGVMLFFGIYLGTRKNRRARRHARFIVFLSLVGIVAGFYLFA